MNIIENENEANETGIILPLKKRELGNFISDLLGQQQSIERTITTKFDINHAWLVNLHDLIHQRICQQASAHIIDFTAVINLDTGIKRSITTIEAFRAYIELRTDSTTSVTMIWSYLIHFPGKNYPEKQEISFHAKARTESQLRNRDDRGFLSKLLIPEGFDWDESFIHYEISHTERTWGDDIETLISNEVNKVRRSEKSIGHTIYNCLRWTLAISIFVTMMTYPLYYNAASNAEVREQIMQLYHALPEKSSSPEIIEEKLNLIASMVAVPKEKAASAFFIISLFLAPVISGIVFRLTSAGKQSFLVLSKHDEARKEVLLKKEGRQIPIMIGSYGVIVTLGILSSFGYDIIKSYVGLI